MDKIKHLLIITNSPAFYKRNLYKEISKYIKVTIIFNGMQCQERRNDFFVDFDGIKTYSLSSKHFFFRLFELIKIMRGIKFSELIIGGWDSLDLWSASYLVSKNKNSMILESSFLESQIKGVKGFLKRFFLYRIAKVYASGENQIKLLKKLKYQGVIVKTRGVGIINFNKQKNRIDKDCISKFLYVGRFSKEKNIEFLIHFFKNKKSLSLSIIGYGQLEKSLKKMAKGYENIKFSGAIDNENIYKFYQAHDVLLIPSTKEPWGLVVEEALYNGLPVIASDSVGCVNEIIKDGINGYVFKSNDYQDFKNKIDSITNTKNYNKLTEHIEKIDFKQEVNYQVNAYL